MEVSAWEEKVQATTHTLTSPSIAPPLYSQLLMSSLLPCYRNWNYPPLLPCPNSPPDLIPDHLRWAFNYLYRNRAPRFGIQETSWRCGCPYLQPPPLILAEGVKEARWGDSDKREYLRKRRLQRKLKRGIDVNPLIPVVFPNLLLLSSLLWNPFPQYD